MTLYQQQEQQSQRNTTTTDYLAQQARNLVQEKKDLSAQINGTTGLDLTPSEYSMISTAMANSKDPDATANKFAQALTYSHNSGITFEDAYNNLDALNLAQLGKKVDVTQTGTKAVVNSFKIGNLTVKRQKAAQKAYTAYKEGKSVEEIFNSDIGAEIQAIDDEITSLQDYTPRAWYTDILKTTANTLSYSFNVAAAAGVGKAIGAVAGSTPVGTGLATLFSFMQGYSLTKYGNWYDNVKDGVDPKVADAVQTISAGIQAAIESVLDVNVGLVRSLGTGTAKGIASGTLKNMYVNGTLNKITMFLTKYGLNMASEGTEEFLQEITDEVGDNVAYALSGKEAPNELKDIISNATQAYIGGASSAIILGIGDAAYETKMNVKYAQSLRQEAISTPSKETFVNRHIEDEALGDTLTRSEKSELLSEAYENTRKTAQEEIKASEATTIDVDYNINDDFQEDENNPGNEEAKVSEQPVEPIKRLDNGRVRTQESTKVTQNTDGTESHTLNIGTRGSSVRYGYIDYTLDTQNKTVTIDEVKTKLGYEDLTRDAVLEVERQYEGWNIEWNPSAESQIKIKDQLINDTNNPNRGNLQWFNEGQDTDTSIYVGNWIKKTFTNLTDEQSIVAANLLQFTAQAQGTDVKTWINDHIQNLDTFDEAGKKGAVKFDSSDIKAIIYAGKNADFSTFSHETFHVLIRTSQAAAQLSTALKNASQTTEFARYINSHKQIIKMDLDEVVEAVKDMGDDPLQWTRSQHEIAATLFESYLRDGQTFNEKLKNIFARIADWFHRIYKAILGENSLNEEIIRAYDEILAGNPELKKAVETSQTVEPTAQETKFEATDYDEDEDNGLDEYGNPLYQTDDEYKETEAILRADPKNFDSNGHHLAPNGQKSNLTYRQWVQVRTESFKKWFGNSQILDSNGEPLVVYHGSINSFDTFNESETGIYFTDNKEAASSYGMGSEPYGVFLKGEDPVTMDFNGDIDNEETEDHYALEDEAINAQENGYDSLIAYNTFDGENDLDQFVVFNANQIKSATDNNGQFDISNPNIYFQSEETEDYKKTEEILKAYSKNFDSEGNHLAPNGKKSNLNYKQWVQVRTEAFKKWFGDWENDPQNASKVLDENGEPKAVTHGTYKAFEVYDSSKIERTSEGFGFYFIDNDIIAGQYGDKFIRAFLNLRNPVYAWARMENNTDEKVDLMLSKLKDKGYVFYDEVTTFADAIKANKTQTNGGVLDEYLDLDGYIEKYKGNEEIDERQLYSDIRQAEIEVYGIDGYKTKNYKLKDASAYVAFLPNQIKDSVNNSGSFSIDNNSILYQLDAETESSLVAEAKDFEDRDEYISYQQAFDMDELSVEELGEIWDKAHGIYTTKVEEKEYISPVDKDMTDDEKDEVFRVLMSKDEGIIAFIQRMREAFGTRYDAMRGHGSTGADTQEEYDIITQEIANADRVESEAAPYIVALAKSPKDISQEAILKVRGMINNSLRDYRDLYSQVIGDQNLAAGMYNEYMPDIKDSRANSMRITERKDLVKRLEGEEIRDAVRRGTEKYDGTAEKVMAVYDKEIKDLQEKYDKLSEQYKSEHLALSREESSNEAKRIKIKKMESAIKRERQIIRQKLDEDRRVPTERLQKLKGWEDELALLHEEVKELRNQDRVKSSLEKYEALQKLRTQIREKQKAKAEAEAVHRYKRDLYNSIVERIPNNVDYSYVQKIQEVIGTIQGIQGYQNETIMVDGNKMALSDFRKAVEDGTIKVEGLSDYQLKRYLNTSLADLTISDLEVLKDTVDYYKQMGKQMWQAKVDQRAFEAQHLRSQIIGEVYKSKHYDPQKDYLSNTAESDKNKKKGRLRGFYNKSLNWNRKAQILDNDTKGLNYDLTVEERRVHQDEQLTGVRDRVNPVKKILEESGLKEQDFYNPVPIVFPDGKTETFTVGRLAYAMLAEKNERNLYAVSYGNLVTQLEKQNMTGTETTVNNQVKALGNSRYQALRSQAEEYFKEHPEYIKVVNAMVDDWNSKDNLARIQKVLIEEYNRPMEVEGFYMTMHRQDFNGEESAYRLRDDMYNLNAGKNTTTPDKGFTESRIDMSPYNQQPVDMDIYRVWLQSVEDQENVIANLSYVRKLNRIYKGYGSRGLRSAIENAYGGEIVTDLDNYINEISNSSLFSDTQEINGIVSKLRGGLYTSYLGYKISGIVLQGITSPMPSLQEVNPVQLAKGLMQMTFHPVSTWKTICELSPYMEHRSMNPAIDAIKKYAAQYTDSKMKTAYRQFLEFGTSGLEAVDRWAVSGSWLAVYDKKLKETGDSKAAAHYADNFIRDTQPSGDITEIAPLFKSKSAFAQAFTQFQVSLNVIWNNVTQDLPKAVKRHEYNKAVGIVFGYALAGALLNLVQGGYDEDDEPEDVAKKLIYSMTTQFTQSTPLAGSVVDAIAQTAITGESGWIYSSNQLYPGISNIASGINTMLTVKDGERKGLTASAIKNIAQGIALTTGLPTSGARELWLTFFDKSFVEAIESGDLNFRFNPGALLGQRDN